MGFSFGFGVLSLRRFQSRLSLPICLECVLPGFLPAASADARRSRQHAQMRQHPIETDWRGKAAIQQGRMMLRSLRHARESLRNSTRPETRTQKRMVRLLLGRSFCDAAMCPERCLQKQESLTLDHGARPNLQIMMRPLILTSLYPESPIPLY